MMVDINKMVREVVEGKEPKEVIEQYTPGLDRVMSTIPKVAGKCQHCGFEMPKYTGRYPNTCPECGNKIHNGK